MNALVHTSDSNSTRLERILAQGTVVNFDFSSTLKQPELHLQDLKQNRLKTYTPSRSTPKSATHPD